MPPIRPRVSARAGDPSLGRNAANLLTNITTEINKLLRPALPADLKSKFSISLNGGPFIDIDLAGFDVTAAANRDDIVSSLATATSSIVKKINDVLHLTDPALNVTGQWDMMEANRVAVLRLTSDSGDKSSVRIARAATNDFAVPMMLGSIRAASRWPATATCGQRLRGRSISADESMCLGTLLPE